MKLALEAFEHFMYADDRPEHPMTFWLRATATGTVEKPRFEAALLKALARQPLLTARLVGEPSDKTSALSWELGVKASPYVDFGHDDEALRFPQDSPAIDLRKEQGLRAFVRQHPRHVVISLQFHHAAIDAIAAARFVEDVLAYYDDAHAPDDRLAPVAPELIQRRGTFQLTAQDRRRRLLDDLVRAFLFFRKRPRPLVVRRAAKPFTEELYPSSSTRLMPTSELAALKNGAGKARVTLNDLMLRDLFLTLDDWNRAHGKREPLRIAMPMNMRRGLDDQIPGANVVSMCFLDRAPAELEDARRLLGGIVRETSYLKDHYMGYALILVTKLAGRIKGGVRWLLTPRLLWRCSSTAVLSNLGDPLRGSRLERNARGEIVAGGLTLTQLELLPPVRPGTALAVGVVTYAGKTSMTFHFDATRLTSPDAEALVGSFHGRLKGSMVAPEPGDTLLERLVQEHTARRQGASAFYGLAIGKHVVPEAPLPPPPENAPRHEF